MTGAKAASLLAVLIASGSVFAACSDSFYFDSAASRLQAGEGGAGDDGGSTEGGSGSYTHCMSDPDCQLANLHCDQFSGACVECVTDANCPATSPRCDGALHRCVDCGVDQNCPQTPKAEICEATTHTCIVTCTEGSGESCPKSAPNCLESLGRCVECRSNIDCVGSGTKLECDPLTGRCTECDRDSECPGNKPRCDRLHDLCVECTSSGDCPAAKPLCDPSTYACVAAH